MGFDKLMQKLAGDLGEDEASAPSILHEGQLTRARELAARVAAGNPFAIGDVVTPRSDAPLKFASMPHVVVASRRAANAVGVRLSMQADWDFRCDEAGTTSFGGVFDLRVAHVQDNRTIMHWVESCYFEAYDPAVHDKKGRR